MKVKVKVDIPTGYSWSANYWDTPALLNPWQVWLKFEAIRNVAMHHMT